MATTMEDKHDDQVDRNTHRCVGGQSQSVSNELMNVTVPTANPFMIKKSKTTEKGPGKTFKLPASSVIQRVQAFLPQLAAADSALQQHMRDGTTSSLDIENVEEDQPHIEMNVQMVEADDSDEDEVSSDCSSLDSDVDGESGIMDEITETNIKLNTQSKKAAKPSIVLLDSVSDHSRDTERTEPTKCDSEKS